MSVPSIILYFPGRATTTNLCCCSFIFFSSCITWLFAAAAHDGASTAAVTLAPVMYRSATQKRAPRFKHSRDDDDVIGSSLNSIKWRRVT
jgi:hypothetical protein